MEGDGRNYMCGLVGRVTLDKIVYWYCVWGGGREAGCCECGVCRGV